MDAAVWGLDLKHPLTIEGRPGGRTNDQIVPHAEIVYYQFGKREGWPEIRLTWYDGGLEPHPVHHAIRI